MAGTARRFDYSTVPNPEVTTAAVQLESARGHRLHVKPGDQVEVRIHDKPELWAPAVVVAHTTTIAGPTVTVDLGLGKTRKVVASRVRKPRRRR